MRYKVAFYVSLVGIILSGIFMGGFSLVFQKMSLKTFEDKILPLLKLGENVSSKKVFSDMQDIASIFAITFFIALILVGIASFLLRYRKKFRLLSAALYAFAGLVILYGSNLLAFPITFLFLISAGICFTRPKNLTEELDDGNHN